MFGGWGFVHPARSTSNTMPPTSAKKNSIVPPSCHGVTWSSVHGMLAFDAALVGPFEVTGADGDAPDLRLIGLEDLELAALGRPVMKPPNAVDVSPERADGVHVEVPVGVAWRVRARRAAA